MIAILSAENISVKTGRGEKEMNLNKMMEFAIQHHSKMESDKLLYQVVITLLNKAFIDAVEPTKRDLAMDKAVEELKIEGYGDSKDYDDEFLELLGVAKGCIMNLSNIEDK